MQAQLNQINPAGRGGGGGPTPCSGREMKSELLPSCRLGDLQAHADVLKGASVEQELLRHECCSFRNNGAKKKEEKETGETGSRRVHRCSKI